MIKLNIACATNIFAGWVNIDRVDVEETYLRHLRGLDTEQMAGWPEEQIAHSKAITEGRILFLQWDLRKGFPMYPDNSIDAIYGGQMIEHLNPLHEVPQFLAECYRMLKPGGRIRLTTPDLNVLVAAYVRSAEDRESLLPVFASEQPAFYKDALPEDQLAYIMYGAGGSNERYEGHQHLFTERSLRQRLDAAGFKVPMFVGCTFNGVKQGPFEDCIDKGMSHSFALEYEK